MDGRRDGISGYHSSLVFNKHLWCFEALNVGSPGSIAEYYDA